MVKKTFYSPILLLLVLSALFFINLPRLNGQIITIDSIALLSYCPGDSIIVPFSISGFFVNGSNFTAQLSNPVGNFSTPLNIGTLTDTNTHIIRCRIPDSTIITTGNFYRIRISFANPLIQYSDSSVNLLINGKPPTPTISPVGPVSLCNGNSVTLRSNIVIGNRWNTLPVQFSDTVSISVAGNFYSYVVAAGCTSNVSSNVQVTVDTLPVISIIGSSSICLGDSVILTASGANTYSWSPGGATTASISVSPVTTTTYTVFGTSLAGCTGSTIRTVTVNPLPSISISGGSATVCGGTSVTMTASGGNTYSWSSGGATSAAITVSPLISTTYTVIGTSLTGCTQSTSRTVNVNPLPPITISGLDSICTGGSDTLTASGANTYSWSPGGATTSAIIVSPVTSITYTVTGTSLAGCTASASRTVAVNPLPLIALSGGSSPVCAGTSVTITASGANIYSWSSGATTAAITVTPLSTITYTVTGTSLGACTSSSSQTVTVNPIPTVLINGGTVPVCAGTSVALTGSGANTYSWSPGGATTFAITVLPSTTTTYTVTGTSLNGCTHSTSRTVTVNPLPSPTINPSGPTTFCEGDSVTLTASGGTTLLWSNNATTQSITVNSIGTNNYSVSVTDGNNCTETSAVTTVTVHPRPPTPTISPGGPISLCAGGNIVLNSSSNSGNVWSGGLGFNSTANVSAPGNYTCRVIVSGCSSLVSNAVVVTLYPALSSTNAVPGPVSLCTGGQDILRVTHSGGSGTGTAFNWYRVSPPLANSIDSDSILQIPSDTAGTFVYHCILTQTGAGCRDTSSLDTVTIAPKPIVSISGLHSVCHGENDSLLAIIQPGTGMNNGGNSYQWVLNGNNVQPDNQNHPILLDTLLPPVYSSGDSVYNYSIRFFEYGAGCSDTSDTFQVRIKPNPSISILSTIPADSICSGQTIVVNMASTRSGTLFNWNLVSANGVTGDTANIVNSATATKQLFNSSITNRTISYQVFGNLNGCFDTANISIRVKPRPIITANDTTICGGNLTLLYLASNTNLPNSRFTWIATATGSNMSGYQSQAAPTTGPISNLLVNSDFLNPGYVTYSVQPSKEGCLGARDSFHVTVNPQPPRNRIFNIPAMICNPAQYIQISVDPNIAISSYHWTSPNPNIVLVNPNSRILQFSINGATGIQPIQLRYSNVFGCSLDTAITILVNAGPAPIAATIIYQGSNLICSDATADTYQWGYEWDTLPFIEIPIPNAIFQNYHISTLDTTKHYWVITTKNGCSTKSYYGTPPFVGIENLEHQDFLVFPNPASDYLTIEIPFAKAEKTEIILVDLFGREILQAAIYPGQKSITLNLNSVIRGFYFIRLFNEGEKTTAIRKIQMH